MEEIVEEASGNATPSLWRRPRSDLFARMLVRRNRLTEDARERERLRRMHAIRRLFLPVLALSCLLVAVCFATGPRTEHLSGWAAAGAMVLTLVALTAFSLRAGKARAAGSALVALAVMPATLVTSMNASSTPQMGVHVVPVLLAPAGLLAATVLPASGAVGTAALLSIYAVAALQWPVDGPVLHGPLTVDLGVILTLSAIALQWICAVAGIMHTRALVAMSDRAEQAEAAAHVAWRETSRVQEESRHFTVLDNALRQLVGALGAVSSGDLEKIRDLEPADTDIILLSHVWEAVRALAMRMDDLLLEERLLLREREQIEALIAVLAAARAGEQVNWPAASGVPLDAVVEALATTVQTPLTPPRPQRAERGTGTLSSGYATEALGTNTPVNSRPLTSRRLRGMVPSETTGPLHLTNPHMPASSPRVSVPWPGTGPLTGMSSSGELFSHLVSGPLPPHAVSGELVDSSDRAPHAPQDDERRADGDTAETDPGR